MLLSDGWVMKKYIICTLVLSLCAVFISAGCCRTETTSAAPSDPNYILIDVRSSEEYTSGHLEGAVNMPHDSIGKNIGETVPDKDSEIYLYCRSGRRVQAAMNTLESMGYKKLRSLGGMEEASRITGRKIVKQQ